ncbi:MAG: hypothetical protein AB7R40_22980 [Nitrospiraceae bacterium]
MTVEIKFISLVPNPAFTLGRLVATAGVHALVQEGRINPSAYLHRHLSGDWGDLSDDDRRSNAYALENGQQILSSYKVAPDLTLWIITEWDRSATTLLLPEEY